MSKVSAIVIDHVRCSQINFPIKSFYSSETETCVTFYRQGFCVTVDPSVRHDVSKKDTNAMSSRFEQITDSDLGSMYLLFDKALVTRSSNSILLFKIDEETGLWTQYHKLPNLRGNIYFIKGNVRIQVVTDEAISFFIFDKQTLMPRLENKMNNDMQCSMMMFGKRVRYGVAYKSNQPGFRIYSRKQYHNFKVAIDSNNFEGSKGCNLKGMNAYAIATNKNITINDVESFKQLQTWNIPVSDSNVPEGAMANSPEILFMTVSADETKIACAIGFQLIKDEEKITEIAVYKRSLSDGKFELEKLREFENEEACIQFCFDHRNNNILKFFCRSEIISLHYNDDAREMETIYEYNTALRDNANFGVFSSDQSKFIISANNDILYVDTLKKLEIDLDDEVESEGIKSIQAVLYDDKKFYVLANKSMGQLGYFLLIIDTENPQAEAIYLINWTNKMDIANCSLQMMTENGIKSLVISYKCIGINTFNVFVIDTQTKLIKYWHESN